MSSIDPTGQVVAMSTVSEVVTVLTAGVVGPEGAEGPEGPQGPEGPRGEAGNLSASYEHVQEVPLSVWVIVHNLGYHPGGVYIQDTGGSTVEGDIAHVSPNELTVSFSASFAGLAYLS